MEKLKTATVTDARQFFAEELRAVMAKHKVTAEPDAFSYLVGLLVRSIQSQALFPEKSEGQYEDQLLVKLYAKYLQSSTEDKKNILQRIGDVSLVISGFFSASLSRKTVDIEYYFGMGGTAYGTLATLSPASSAIRSVYEELSKKFQPYSDVLGEMSERSGLQSNKDLLRLYERWLVTGNERLKSLLTEHGIQPVTSDRSNKH